MKKDVKKTYHICDIDCDITVWEVSTRKEIFSWLDEYLENLAAGFHGDYDDTFQIAYEDGTSEYIDCDFDGHKIRRQHIKSMVYSNPEDYIIFGNYELSRYGVAYTADETYIDPNCQLVAVSR